MLSEIKIFLISNFPIIISTTSLIISLLTYLSNKKRLNVSIEDLLVPLDILYLSKDIPFITLSNGYTCFIKIVNLSPKDIAFFDLTVYDTQALNSLFFITNTFLEIEGLHQKSLFYINGTAAAKIYIPEATSGILNSNSFKRLEIPFCANDETKSVTISFKVAIPKLFPSFKFTQRRSFKYYKKTINIPKNS